MTVVCGMHSHATVGYDFPPLSAVGAFASKSRIDFGHGFGLDVPLESEERRKTGSTQRAPPLWGHEEQKKGDGDRTRDIELENDASSERGIDATTAGPESRLHSRHLRVITSRRSLRARRRRWRKTRLRMEIPMSVR